MTDLDLERLGDVWRQEPDPRELEELRRTAETVRRRARWLQVLDIVVAIAVAGVVLWLTLMNPAIDTVLVGGGAILFLLISQIRSRRFRQRELRSLTGSAEQMLDQSIDRVRATLKRARALLIAMPPGFLLGMLVAYVSDLRSGGEVARRIEAYSALGTIFQVVAIAAVIFGVIHFVRTLVRSRRELERLCALREAYREEGDATNAG